MFTANYEFCNTQQGSDTERSRSKYRKPLAFIFGTINGVAFRQQVKTQAALERAVRSGFEVVLA